MSRTHDAFLLTFCVLLAAAAARAGGPDPHRIGAPCVAGEDAMQLYSDAAHGGKVDMTGKVAVVTGSDTGIGLEVARALAARNATVVMAAHSLTHAATAAADIRRTVPTAKILIPSAIDLSSMNSTRAYVEAAHKALNGAPVDVLVNDAAMANNPHGYTSKDLDQNGKPFEMLFEVNYVNQWLLVDLFLPQLRAAKGRVVNLVSKAYRMSCPLSMRRNCVELSMLPPPVVTTDPNKTVPILGVKPSNYGIAKLLMIRWTQSLSEREAANGVTAYSVDPGFVNTSMAGQSSPFWTKLACEDEGRPGAPCPVPSNQGALTPAFLSLSPKLDGLSGQYFEWCTNFTVNNCLDSIYDTIHRTCALSSQSDRDALWALSARWVANYSAPIGTAVSQLSLPAEAPLLASATASCPAILRPLCALYNASQCFAQCKPQISACTSDATCRKSLENAGECMAMSKLRNTSAQNALTCLIPDNKLRDDVFYCLLDEHNCIPTPQDGPIYPTCRDASLTGATTFSPASLEGDWFKSAGWTKGEPYECRPCARVQFWNASLTPTFPVGHGPSKPDPQTMIISSTWLEKDIHGKQWQMNDTSYFGPRSDRVGFPAKLQHYGVMLGLSYDELFTVVHDGTREAEPFVFLYGCGKSKQGAYVTGLVLSRMANVSATLHERIGAVATANGFAAQDWCTVDNSCADRV